MFPPLAALLLALAALAYSSPTLPTPLPPSKDPWYTAPKNFEHASPGEVLRVRVAPGNLTTLVSNTSQAYHILYRTTDARYQPSWAVTTLFLPQSSSSASNAQVAYDSPNIDESPSWAYYAGQNPSNAALLFVDVEWALGKGWFVNVPDYEGPLAAFISGPQAGHATLDSIRAVQSLSLGLAPDARVALWGYSGGSFASEYAAETKVQYAPELQISGVALGGLVSNASRGIQDVNSARFAGLMPVGLPGAVAQYPDAKAYVLDQLLPSGPHNSTTFLLALTRPLTEILAIFAGQDVFSYFRSTSAVLSSPLLSRLLSRDAVLGTAGVPRVPLFVYNAVHDEITRIADVESLVRRYCAYGADVWLQRNTVGNHVAEVVNGKPRAKDFLEQVLEGTYVAEGCRVEDVTVNITAIGS